MGFSCVVENCKNHTRDISMHRFPGLFRDFNRYKAWLVAVNARELFTLPPDRVQANYRVCGKHFSLDQWEDGISAPRLKRTAVPNLHLGIPVPPALWDHDYTCVLHDKATKVEKQIIISGFKYGLDEDMLNIKSTNICLFCTKLLSKDQEVNIISDVTKEGKLLENYLRTSLLYIDFDKPLESYYMCLDCFESVNEFEEYFTKCNSIQDVLRMQYEKHKKLKENKYETEEEAFLRLNLGVDGIRNFESSVLSDGKSFSTRCTQTGEEDVEEPQGSILRELLTDNNVKDEDLVVGEGEKFYSDGMEITNPVWISRLKRQQELGGKDGNVKKQPKPLKVKVKKEDKVPPHSESGYCCDKCGKVIWKFTAFKRHEAVHKNEGRYVCEVCNKSFTTSTVLKDHALMHTGLKPHACESCGKKFRSKAAMNMHRTSMHPTDTNNSGFCCEKCGKHYYSFYAFAIHMRMHKHENKLRCEICDKTFSQMSGLKKHKLVHQGVRPYKCKICEKTYRYKNQIVSHFNAHNNIRNFVCDTCGKGFYQKKYLEKHKNVHLTVKPYTCPVCQKGFSDESNMRVHLKSQHKEINE